MDARGTLVMCRVPERAPDAVAGARGRGGLGAVADRGRSKHLTAPRAARRHGGLWVVADRGRSKQLTATRSALRHGGLGVVADQRIPGPGRTPRIRRDVASSGSVEAPRRATRAPDRRLAPADAEGLRLHASPTAALRDRRLARPTGDSLRWMRKGLGRELGRAAHVPDRRLACPTGGSVWRKRKGLGFKLGCAAHAPDRRLACSTGDSVWRTRKGPSTSVRSRPRSRGAGDPRGARRGPGAATHPRPVAHRALFAAGWMDGGARSTRGIPRGGPVGGIAGGAPSGRFRTRHCKGVHVTSENAHPSPDALRKWTHLARTRTHLARTRTHLAQTRTHPARRRPSQHGPSTELSSLAHPELATPCADMDTPCAVWSMRARTDHRVIAPPMLRMCADKDTPCADRDTPCVRRQGHTLRGAVRASVFRQQSYRPSRIQNWPHPAQIWTHLAQTGTHLARFGPCGRGPTTELSRLPCFE